MILHFFMLILWFNSLDEAAEAPLQNVRHGTHPSQVALRLIVLRHSRSLGFAVASRRYLLKGEARAVRFQQQPVLDLPVI